MQACQFNWYGQKVQYIYFATCTWQDQNPSLQQGMNFCCLHNYSQEHCQWLIHAADQVHGMMMMMLQSHKCRSASICCMPVQGTECIC